MRWWLALWLMTASVAADLTHINRIVAITKNCSLQVLRSGPNSIYSDSDGKCADDVEFSVVENEYDSALFVFRRHKDSQYKLDVFGTIIDDVRDDKIDLEKEFETIDLEYALRRDGYDCYFGGIEEGGFAAAIDLNVMHILVRCKLSDASEANPRVYLPQFVNEFDNKLDAELFGLLRFSVHPGIQMLTVPMSGLVLFKLDSGLTNYNVSLIPSNDPSYESRLFVYKENEKGISSYQVKIHELYGIPKDFDNENTDTSFHYDDIVRFITKEKKIIKKIKKNSEDRTTINYGSLVADLTIYGDNVTHIFPVRVFKDTEVHHREWSFRTIMDPISTPKGMDLIECDKKLIQQINDCYETRAKKEGSVYLIGFGGIGGTFGLLLTTIILFSCCIFKQRKRRKLIRQHRKERKMLKQRKNKTSDGTATDGTKSKVSNAVSDPKA